MKVPVKSIKERKLTGDRIMAKTKSVCPVCLGVIEAMYLSRGEKVYMEKQCAKHGNFSAHVWTGANEFAKLVKAGTGQACRSDPKNCAGCDEHQQKTCCVLLEITGRCNLSCPVCFAGSSEGVKSDDPTLETISDWYDVLMENGGPFNIQLSGGEPSLRNDLPEIIRIGKEKGFPFFQLNTNGIRLGREPEFARTLADAGLNTVFLQFDGLSDEVYKQVRGRALIEEKEAAIENCGRAGLGVVLVPTIVSGINNHEVFSILEYAKSHSPSVRGVHFQPVSFFGRYPENSGSGKRITIPDLLSDIEKQSAGEIKKSDFSPANAEHPLCSFHADYLIEADEFVLQESASSGCCCSVSSDQSRRVVARKWSSAKFPENLITSEEKQKYKLDAFDVFLKESAEREAKKFALSGMAFQDAWNFDLDRIGRCYISEVSPDGQMIPFCAYNLTDLKGKGIYRK